MNWTHNNAKETHKDNVARGKIECKIVNALTFGSYIRKIRLISRDKDLESASKCGVWKPGGRGAGGG